MQELIAITKQDFFNGSDANSVDAREIHKFLGVKSRFNDWFNNRATEYFTKGEDYIVVTKKLVTDPTDIFVTMDMAKHLAMIENNPKGREARQYFIEVEKQSRRPIALSQGDQIKLIAQGYDTLEIRIDNIENNSRLSPQQEFALIQEKNTTVYRLADGDKKAATAIHRTVWSLFKKRFQLPRFNALTTGNFQDGLVFLRGLSLADVVKG